MKKGTKQRSNKKDLVIDQEFAEFLPPGSEGEYAKLKESILQEGCRHPLLTWEHEGRKYLIDGFRRREICVIHGLHYDTEDIDIPFNSRDEVKLWMYRNQNCRRNMTRYSQIEVALKLKDTFEAKAKENQRAAGGDKRSQNPQPLSTNLSEAVGTRALIAKLAGYSEGTVYKVEYIIEHADKKKKNRLREGGISIGAAYTELKKPESDEKQDDSPPPLPKPHQEAATATQKTDKETKQESEAIVASGEDHNDTARESENEQTGNADAGNTDGQGQKETSPSDSERSLNASQQPADDSGEEIPNDSDTASDSSQSEEVSSQSDATDGDNPVVPPLETSELVTKIIPSDARVDESFATISASDLQDVSNKTFAERFGKRVKNLPVDGKRRDTLFPLLISELMCGAETNEDR